MNEDMTEQCYMVGMGKEKQMVFIVYVMRKKIVGWLLWIILLLSESLTHGIVIVQQNV